MTNTSTYMTTIDNPTHRYWFRHNADTTERGLRCDIVLLFDVFFDIHSVYVLLLQIVVCIDKMGLSNVCIFSSYARRAWYEPCGRVCYQSQQNHLGIYQHSVCICLSSTIFNTLLKFSQLKRRPRDQGPPYRWVRFVLPGAAMNPAAALLAGMRPPMLNPLLAAGLRPGGLPGLPSMPGASLRSEKLDTLRDEP